MHRQIQSSVLRVTIETQLAIEELQTKSKGAMRRLASERGDAASSVIMMAGMAAAAVAVVAIVTIWLRGRANDLNNLPSTATTVPTG